MVYIKYKYEYFASPLIIYYLISLHFSFPSQMFNHTPRDKPRVTLCHQLNYIIIIIIYSIIFYNSKKILKMFLK